MCHLFYQKISFFHVFIYKNVKQRVYIHLTGEFETPGLGFLRLHSTFRHDLKIYASDEGRVQMTAAAFTKVTVFNVIENHVC